MTTSGTRTAVNYGGFGCVAKIAAASTVRIPASCGLDRPAFFRAWDAFTSAAMSMLCPLANR